MDGDTGGSPKSRVFIVEDDPDLLQTYELWLASDDGIDVETAYDGAVALDSIDDDVDVLVLDRDLPELSGPELLDRLSADGFDVVVVSAYQPDAHLRAEHVTDYLVKPVRRVEFLETVRGFLP